MHRNRRGGDLFGLGCVKKASSLLVCDGIWLGRRSFYRDQLGSLMLPSPNPAASIATAFLHGAILGLAAYGTHDITNLATLRNWPAARHEPGRHGLGHAADGADSRRRISRRQIFWLKREPGDKSLRPDNEHWASRLGTKFKLVKIVILYLTNVQNIHVTLVGARPLLE